MDGLAEAENSAHPEQFDRHTTRSEFRSRPGEFEQRYALYLSTLSYQQLRAKHGGNVELANRELADHLRFIRGDTKAGADIAKRSPTLPASMRRSSNP